MALLSTVASAGFVAARSYPAGSAPVSVAVGDFNGDGIPDLAVLDLSTDAHVAPALSVSLGRGNGSFGALQFYTVGTAARSIAAGDFNGDGYLDLAVGNSGEDTVSVFFGNGDGTFQAAKDFIVGFSPGGVAVGDFNGDGRTDLAVTTRGPSNTGMVSVLVNQGDGTFQAPENFAVGAQTYFLAVGDFNGDGILDIAVTFDPSVTSLQGSLGILLGNGDGSFQAVVDYPVGVEPRTVVVGDFNSDGNLDIALANLGIPGGAWALSVLLGNGDGTFQAAIKYPTFPPAQDDTGNYTSLAVGDFNGDGHLDLALTGQVGVVIWVGQGDGSFQAGPTYNVGTGSVAVADFKQDGHADLAVTNAEANAVRILLGRGDGTFQAASSYPSGSGDASTVAVGDFNGDGIPDLALGNIQFNTGAVAIWLGNGDGTFRHAKSFPTDAGPVGVAAADFNGDGKQDLLVTVNFYGFPRLNLPRISGLRVWLGNGDGTFVKGSTYDTDVGFYGATIGDFNADGIPDVAAPNYGWPSEGGQTVTVLLGKGDGTLHGKQTYGVLEMPSAVVLADFNGDGNLDMAVAAPGGLSILLGNGDGTFQAAQNYAQVPSVSLTVADFNGDGHLDIAVWMAGVPGTPGTVQLLLGQGDGTFQPGPSYPAGSAALYTSAGLVAGDFNGDGVPDLAVTDSATGSVSVLLGKGDGTFAELQSFAVGFPVNSLAVADFNGDGNLDLAVACGSTLTILLNDGQWSP